MPDDIKNAVTVIENVILLTLLVDKHSLSNYSWVSQEQHSMYQEQACTEVGSVTKKLNFCKTWETLLSSQVQEDSC